MLIATLNHQKNVNIVKLHVGFHLIFIKSLQIYYKNLLLLFKPFHGSEDYFLNQHVSWKDYYFNVKNDIEIIN